MKGIWSASVDEDKPSAVLSAWWTFWIISGILCQISLRLTLNEGDEGFLLILDTITTILAIPLLFAILKIMREITEAQKAKEQSTHIA